MLRLARPILLLAVAACVGASTVGHASAESPSPDLRGLTAHEVVGISNALNTKFPGDWSDIANGRVSEKLGLGAVDLEIGGLPRTALLGMYPDGTASYVSDLTRPAKCGDTRNAKIFDVVAEALAVVAADNCSRGRPLHLRRSDVTTLATLKRRADRGMKPFRRAVRACADLQCMSKALSRHMSRRLARVTAKSRQLRHRVSWSFCPDRLSELEDHVFEYRTALAMLVFAEAANDRSAKRTEDRKLAKTAKALKNDLSSVRAECVYYPPN